MKNVILLIISLIFTFDAYSQSEAPAIHVEVIGTGQPVILIPGFTVPGEVWHPLVKGLEKKYECHLLTLAGFGGKAPIEFPWLSKVNTSIKEYIKINKLKNPIIIGHSLGGTIATWLATHDDLNVSEVILINALPASGALMIPNFNPDNLKYDSPYNRQQLAMDPKTFDINAQAMANGMSNKVFEQEKIKNWILQADRKTYVYAYTDYLKLDLREDLKNITVPVTIFAATLPYGEEMVTQTYSSQYENLKEYKLIIAEDSAHFIMLDKPKWFIDQIQMLLLSKK